MSIFPEAYQDPFIGCTKTEKGWRAEWGIGLLVYGTVHKRDQAKALAIAKKKLTKDYARFLRRKEAESTKLRLTGAAALWVKS